MQIKINLRIFFFIIIFFITRQIKIYGLLMLFAFFHEMGHLIVGLLLGFKPKSISFNPLGLEIKFKVNANDFNYKIHNANILSVKKILIALAGPITNFVLVAIFLNQGNELITYSNLLIGLFNLIPIYPLDGGRVVKYLIHIFRGLEKSYIYSNIISNVCVIMLTFFASIGILYLKNIAVLFIIIYLWYLVIMENRMHSQRQKMYEILYYQKDNETKKENVNI